MDNNLSFWLFVFVQPIVFAAFIFAALYMLSGWGILRSRFAHDQKPVGTEYRFIRFSVGFLFPVRFFGGLAVMHAQGLYLKPAISLVFKPISIPWHQIASIEQPGYLFGGAGATAQRQIHLTILGCAGRALKPNRCGTLKL